MVKEIKTVDEFKTIVTDEKSNLIVVDFFATWCGPCKMIAPKFVKMSEKYTDVSFYKIDCDNMNMRNVCNAYEIKSMPTFCFFRDQKMVGKLSGANPDAIEKLINQHNIKKTN